VVNAEEEGVLLEPVAHYPVGVTVPGKLAITLLLSILLQERCSNILKNYSKQKFQLL
jgi:hypothetical protein